MAQTKNAQRPQTMATTETVHLQDDTDESTPSIDDVLHILQNERRRYTIFYLKHVDGKVDLGHLSEQVAAWENNVHPDKLTSKQRKRVYIALYQNHLSRMEEDGIVEYNSERGIVSSGDNAEIVEYYMGGPLSETPALESEITRDELLRDTVDAFDKQDCPNQNRESLSSRVLDAATNVI